MTVPLPFDLVNSFRVLVDDRLFYDAAADVEHPVRNILERLIVRDDNNGFAVLL